MTKLTIEILCDNDAFQPQDEYDAAVRNSARDREISRILRELTYQLDYGPAGESQHGYREHNGHVLMVLFDRNNSVVGLAEIDPTKG